MMDRSMLERLRHQALRELAKTDVYAFGEYVFGYKPAEHHRQMVDFVLERIDKGENGVVLAPRGAAKSTWLNTILNSFLVATRPDIRIGLFSQKDKKAEAMSAAVRWTISESEAFREVFGDLRSPAKWTDAEWLRKGSRWAASKDRTMVTGGVNNSSAVSKRFDYLCLDDILDAENTYNIDRREKTEDWFWKTMKPAQAAEGVSIIAIGTRWTEGDLYERLIETNRWPSLVISAITIEEDGSETSYWPSVWPIERLHTEREDVGWDNFACSYLNDISGSREGFIFKRDWFQYFDELPRDRRYKFTMGVDLASSERERADWTARAVVAEDEDHHHWVMGTYRVKTETGHRQFVKDGAAAFPAISRIIIETNQHQSTLVQDLLNETNLPVVGRRTDVDKRTRARAVSARYESHRVHHHRSLKGGELESEMLGFPKGHDDLIDALGLAMDVLSVSGSIAHVTAPLRGPDGLSVMFGPTDAQINFVDGPRWVPTHVAEMLKTVDTFALTYEQAMAQANAAQASRYVNNLMGGLLRR
jgi:predicted phage terminase large subunit-like protein